MDNSSLCSWFLGLGAENADIFERLVLEALRDTVFWRRNVHPEDASLITERVKRDEAFQDSITVLQQEFSNLLATLKRDIPFFSRRYIGHMPGDQLLPAIAGYLSLRGQEWTAGRPGPGLHRSGTLRTAAGDVGG